MGILLVFQSGFLFLRIQPGNTPSNEPSTFTGPFGHLPVDIFYEHATICELVKSVRSDRLASIRVCGTLVEK